jgi:hypothetical protein
VNDSETIGQLVAKARAVGYDADLEATLAKVWLCPWCQRRATILEVLIPIDSQTGKMVCPRCMCEGI